MGTKKKQMDDVYDRLIHYREKDMDRSKKSGKVPGISRKVLKAWRDLEGSFYNDLKDEELPVYGSSSTGASVDLPSLADEFKAHETVEPMESQVDHPAHYNNGSIECIDGIKAALTTEEYIGFLKGNVLKYLWRCGSKGKFAEDLKKGRWYLERLIAEQEKLGEI